MVYNYDISQLTLTKWTDHLSGTRKKVHVMGFKGALFYSTPHWHAGKSALYGLYRGVNL